MQFPSSVPDFEPASSPLKERAKENSTPPATNREGIATGALQNSEILDERIQRVGDQIIRDRLVFESTPLPRHLRIREIFFKEIGDANRIRQTRWVANRVLISVDPAVLRGSPEFNWFIERNNLEMEPEIPLSPLVRIRLGKISMDGVDRLMVRMREEFRQLEGRFHRDSILFPVATEANDPSYTSQWHHAALGSPTAWDLTTGGAETVVAVIDTGLNTYHEDFYFGAASNIWTNPGETIDRRDNDGNGRVDDIIGWDFVQNTGLAQPVGIRPGMTDVNGHGTQMAGVIGAFGNNATGVTGIAWRTQILPLRVGTNDFQLSDIIAALDYLVWLRTVVGIPIAAINNSYGYTPGIEEPQTPIDWSESNPLGQAIERTRQAGLLFVAAAGNSGRNNDAGDSTHFFPSDAIHANVISVAAMTESGTLWSSSNYGPDSVDIAAPGASILTTHSTGDYTTRSGTSFAAPMVCGAAALLASVRPEMSLDWQRDVLLLATEPSAAVADKVSTGGVLKTSLLGDLASLTLPEIWRRLYWAGPELVPVSEFDWYADADHDGQPHLLELLFGTDPTVAEPATASFNFTMGSIQFDFSVHPRSDAVLDFGFDFNNGLSPQAWETVSFSRDSLTLLGEDPASGILRFRAELTPPANIGFFRFQADWLE